MLSTQPLSLDVLDSFSDLHLASPSLSPSPASSPSTPARSRPLPRTFTRVARTVPIPIGSPSSLLLDIPISKPTLSDSVARRDSGHGETVTDSDSGPVLSSSHGNSSSTNYSNSSSSGLNRFRPCLPTINSCNSQPSAGFLALDEKTTRPCPTFTRISKLPSLSSTSSLNYTNNRSSFSLSSSPGSKGPVAYTSAGARPSGLSLSLSLSPPPSAVPSLSSASSTSSSCSSSSPSPSSTSISSPSQTRFIFPTSGTKDWWLGLSLSETPSREEEEDRVGLGAGTGAGFRSGSHRTPQDRPSSGLDPHLVTPARPLSPLCLDESSPCSAQMSPQRLRAESVPSPSLPPSSRQGFQQIRPNSGSTTPVPTKRTHFPNRTRNPSPPPVLSGFCSLSKNTIKSSGEPSPQDFLGEADLPYPLPSTLQERQARQRKRAEQLRQLKIREEREARENLVNMIMNSKNNTISHHQHQQNGHRPRMGVRRRGASFSAGMYGTSHPALASSPSFPTPGSSSPSCSLSRSLSSSWMTRHNHGALSFGGQQRLKRWPSSPARSTNSLSNTSINNNSNNNDNNSNNNNNNNNISGDFNFESFSFSKSKSNDNDNHDIKDTNIDSNAIQPGNAKTPNHDKPARKHRLCVGFDLRNNKVFEYDSAEKATCSASAPSSPTLSRNEAKGYFSFGV